MTSSTVRTFSDLQGRKVGVFGLGVEGRATLRRLDLLGITSGVVDDAPKGGDGSVLQTSSGGLEALFACEVILKTPGISKYRDEVIALEAAGIEIRSALDLWFGEVDPSGVVMVTGTKGKSTTTSFLAHLLQGLGKSVVRGGNIGHHPYDSDGFHGADFTILEISSFQAEAFTAVPPLVGVTSLGEDHLDWHGSVDRYVLDKLSLTSKPGASVAVVADEAALRAQRENLGPNPVFVQPTDVDRALASAVGLSGDHHHRNVAVARALLERLIGPREPEALLAAAIGYKHLESRFTDLQPLGAIRVIDDSLATNPLPTVAGLTGLLDDRVALILGGRDRGVSYEPLAEALEARTLPTLVLCLPENGARIASTLHESELLQVNLVETLPEAVALGLAWLAPAGVLLLSPAAPSFGQFLDYRDRALSFAEAVDLHRNATMPSS
ncbi:MAG: UDP-N-acetylmuramoyl-L-alanine--D-glutamate ligase [Actinomycetota bacterium]